MVFFILVQKGTSDGGVHIVEPLTERGLVLYFDEREWNTVRRMDRFTPLVEYAPKAIPNSEFDSLYEKASSHYLSRIGARNDFNPADTPQLDLLVQESMG